MTTTLCYVYITTLKSVRVFRHFGRWYSSQGRLKMIYLCTLLLMKHGIRYGISYFISTVCHRQQIFLTHVVWSDVTEIMWIFRMFSYICSYRKGLTKGWHWGECKFQKWWKALGCSWKRWILPAGKWKCLLQAICVRVYCFNFPRFSKVRDHEAAETIEVVVVSYYNILSVSFFREGADEPISGQWGWFPLCVHLGIIKCNVKRKHSYVARKKESFVFCVSL